MITIIIDTSNDAFQDDTGEELSRLLWGVATTFRLNGKARTTGMTLQDLNGNTVGRVHGDLGLGIDGQPH